MPDTTDPDPFAARYITRSGRALTDADVGRLAGEAEAGYPVDQLAARTGPTIDPLYRIPNDPVDERIVLDRIAAAVARHGEDLDAEIAELAEGDAWRMWLALGRRLLRPQGRPASAYRVAVLSMLLPALHTSYAAGVEPCQDCAEGIRHTRMDIDDRRHVETLLAALGEYEPPKVGKHEPPVEEQVCHPIPRDLNGDQEDGTDATT